MAHNPNKEQDFYIGWQEQAPAIFASKVKAFVIGIMLLIPLVVVLLVLNQKGFKSSVFELGQLTTLEGVLIDQPVPMLKTQIGLDANQQPLYQSIVLVGFGKKGAEQDLANITQTTGETWVNHSVKLRGTLIYYDGKVVLELSEGAAAFVERGKNPVPTFTKKQALGDIKLRGEIYDPKCALGVMKPGYGKSHRSCAVRCISGGIPPLFRVANLDQSVNYFLLLDEQGNKLNEQVLDYVADQIQICGRLEQQDDWMFLYLNPSKDIVRLQHHSLEGAVVLCGDQH